MKKKYDKGDSFPKLELSDLQRNGEDYNENDSEKRARFMTKEDEDVAVFMEIAKQMDMKSLMFLMQCQAREGNLQLQQSIQAEKAKNQKAAKKDPASGGDEVKKPPPKIKKFRFAEVNNNQVRCVVHKVPKINDKALWWSDTEMNAIRMDAIQVVQYYSRCRPSYEDTIIAIAQSYMNNPCLEDDDIDSDEEKQSSRGRSSKKSSGPTKQQKEYQYKRELETKLKQLANDSSARGLEVHIVTPLAELKRAMAIAVLQEQHRCKHLAQGEPGLDKDEMYEVVSERIRDIAIQISEPSRTLASKMAEFDHLEALKSSISKWKVLRR